MLCAALVAVLQEACSPLKEADSIAPRLLMRQPCCSAHQADLRSLPSMVSAQGGSPADHCDVHSTGGASWTCASV